MVMRQYDVVRPLLKYSYATGTRADGTIPWTHIQGDEIFIIVGNHGTTQGSQGLTMRVVQGNDVLVSLSRQIYATRPRQMVQNATLT